MNKIIQDIKEKLIYLMECNSSQNEVFGTCEEIIRLLDKIENKRCLKCLRDKINLKEEENVK